MRTKIFTLMIAGLFLTSSCSDNNEDHESVGKWKLIEQYMDPGDGSGDYVAVDSEKTLEFFSNGWINTKGTLCNISIDVDEDGNATYSAQDQIIYPKGCSSSDMRITYEIKDNYLYLYYPCIEGCGQKYKKI